jgi:hypothetical protein
MELGLQESLDVPALNYNILPSPVSEFGDFENGFMPICVS